LEFVDVIRIDHFRGFVAYYAIDRGMPNAKVGEWIRVPVYEFFDTIKANFPSMPFIAEDLGLITDDVVEVIKHYEIPNMRILMFAFDGSPTNPYLPHNYENPNGCLYRYALIITQLLVGLSLNCLKQAKCIFQNIWAIRLQLSQLV